MGNDELEKVAKKQLRLKTVCDVTKQLRSLHKLDFIFFEDFAFDEIMRFHAE